MAERRFALPTTVTVAALLAWSVLSYLTAWVDSDIVSDAIQVQQFVAHPFYMVTYPGQPYGGVLEAPLIALAEAIAPGNPYGFTLLRVLFLPLVGLLTCVNVRRVDRSWSLWPVAACAIVGPAVLHSQLPIKDLYPLSWLLGMSGVTVLFSQFPHGRSTWRIVAGALLVGLAGYEHPTSLLFSIPLIAAGLVHWGVRGRPAFNTVIGIVIGLLPLLFQPERSIVYGTGAPSGPRIVEAFGLGAHLPWASAIVPGSWGIQSTNLNEYAFPAAVQTAINAALLALCAISVVAFVVAAADYLHARAPRRFAFIATLWGLATLLVAALTVLVRPSLLYGGSLALLVPFTLAALPSILDNRPRIIVTSAVLLAMAVTSAGTLAGTTPSIPQAIAAKADRVAAVQRTAAQIRAAGFDYVVGDYWDVMPVGFASAGQLHPLAFDVNRFGLAPGAGTRLVAVLGDGHDLELRRRSCTPVVPDHPLPDGVTAYACPTSAFES